jgi:hypothetical protein
MTCTCGAIISRSLEPAPAATQRAACECVAADEEMRQEPPIAPTTGAALQDERPYSAAWRRYRRWSRAFWLVFVLYLPALGFGGRALGWTHGDGGAIFFAASVWMLAFLVIGYRKSNFQCPRCGELFFHRFDGRLWRRDWQHNPFARRCMHCGLPKWASANPTVPHEPSPGH